MKSLAWPLGAVITQGCHAVSAVLWENRDDPAVVKYMRDLPNMHKVTLQVKNEAQLLKLAENLKENKIVYHLWTEQPENVSTSLATKPYLRSELGDMLKKCQLFS